MPPKRRRLDRLLSELENLDDPNLAAAAMVSDQMERLEDRLATMEKPPPSNGKAAMDTLLKLLVMAVAALVAATIYHQSQIAVINSNRFTDRDAATMEAGIRSDMPPEDWRVRIRALESLHRGGTP